MTKVKGFKPFSYQRAVIDEIKDALGTGKIITVLSPRQRGKSFMVANILLYYAINFERTKNFYLSITLKQAKALFKLIVDACYASGIIKTNNGTELTIEFINGSSISFKSAEQGDALRGYTVTGILCIDECAFISDEIFELVRPWVNFHNCPIVMCSTPFIKEGYFYRYFNYGLEKTHNTVTINWMDEKFKEDMDIVMPPEKLAEIKTTVPANVFKTEYLAEFLDDDGSVFTNFKNCLLNTTITFTDRLFVGIDWSNQGNNDYTVVSVFNQHGNQVLLRYWNDLTPLGQIDEIVKTLKPYEKQIVLIQPELNSIGVSYTEHFKKKWFNQSQIIGFMTTNQSKADLVADIQVAFEQQSITLLNDEKMLREFSFYTAVYNAQTRNVIYNAPQGLNDDTVMATMIAYHNYKNNKGGTYKTR